MADDAFDDKGGFGLVELMLACAILACGLLAAAPLLSTTARLTAQSRSRSTAALEAQGALERLAALYRQNPAAAELALGTHRQEALREIRNPMNSSVLDRYEIAWDATAVPDPRPGAASAALPGREVVVRVTPVRPDGEPMPDKALSVNAILGAEL